MSTTTESEKSASAGRSAAENEAHQGGQARKRTQAGARKRATKPKADRANKKAEVIALNHGLASAEMSAHHLRSGQLGCDRAQSWRNWREGMRTL